MKTIFCLNLTAEIQMEFFRSFLRNILFIPATHITVSVRWSGIIGTSPRPFRIGRKVLAMLQCSKSNCLRAARNSLEDAM
jgi:hypothetical protein